jgi:hypothetical protein
MKPRDIARVSLLAGSLMIGSLLLSRSDMSGSDPLTASGLESSAVVMSPSGGIVTGGRGVYIQQLGCEKARKPNCNKPGRRSTHR